MSFPLISLCSHVPLSPSPCPIAPPTRAAPTTRRRCSPRGAGLAGRDGRGSPAGRVKGRGRGRGRLGARSGACPSLCGGRGLVGQARLGACLWRVGAWSVWGVVSGRGAAGPAVPGSAHAGRGGGDRGPAPGSGSAPGQRSDAAAAAQGLSGTFPQVKLTQELRVHLLEQLSGLQSKQQRDAELLEDIRSYSKQRATIDREYGQALQRLASQFVKRDWQRGRGESGDSRSVAAVWKGVIEGTAHAGQVRVTASESYRALAAEAARSARLSKERTLKKGIERLQKAQVELLETVKELDKAKKQFSHLRRSSEVAKDKAADVEARLRKSDRRIFHTKASLQKLSAKFSARLAEHSRQLAGVQNEYSFALVSASAHLEHYQRVELPAAMQALDGDLYERLREHLSAASRTEVETCRATRDWFQGVVEASARVCREQDLLLFLQDHPAFSLAPEQRFQLTGVEEVCLLPPADDGASLEKEARRWATRVAREHKNRAHSEEVLQRLEARRQQGLEAEVAAVERQMEEVRENIRKAEVSRVKAEARLALLRAAGLDVDTWLAGAMVGTGEETPTGLDPAEFDDYEDSDEPDEDDEPGPAARTYPYTCRVIFGYQGCQADELSISQGEELEIIEDGDAEEWVKARNKAGQVGYVPEKYLLSLGCDSGAGLGPPGPCALHRQLSSIMAAELVLEPGAWLVRALYDYEGQSPEELSFPEGAIIRVLPRAAGEVDDGFWTGDFDGRVGVFPSLVVEELTGAREAAGQELPSPSPPPFSPPGLAPGASLVPSPAPETALGGCRQDGTGSGQSSPDLAATRLRPLRAPPPPPGRAPEPDPELHFS
ncbi:F-BAR and double SH3 domains protein 1 isoform X2 [Pyrgilauda ruficollis]|uniref:F-BAR and double SH3 domains protein 1 isoform X2 n=1 Tax=Pyrgilauda ruficollis TaxID=221976 RepID=UPI001B87D3FB|nr:F-BAR and double SH3 domains protein 1 isoform X2 [Pyrgilauda ruficollis]